MNNSRIGNTFDRVIIALTAVFVFSAFLLSLIFLKGTSAVSAILLSLLFLIVFYWLFKAVDRLNKRKVLVLSIFLFSVFIALEIGSLIFLKASPATDAFRCIDTAISFIQDEGLVVDEAHKHFNYFSMYSNNNFFVEIIYLFYKIVGIKEPILSIKILNAFLIFLSVLLSYFCVKKIACEKTALKFLIFCIFNPCFYIIVHWCYTLTFSLPIMSATVLIYLYIKSVKSVALKSILSLIEGILGAVGFLLRPTCVFPLIAIGFVSLFKVKVNKNFIKKSIICCLSFLLCFSLSFVSFSSLADKRFKTDPNTAFPITHWVMMGLSETGGYSGYDVRITMNKAKNKAEKTALNKKIIIKRLKNLNFLKHYLNKVNNTFALGTYRVGGRIGGTNTDNSLNKYINGDFEIYCQGYKIFMYLSMLLCLFFVFKNKENRLMPFIITVFGAFVFYMIWESKQIYSFVFIEFFSVLAVFGIEKTIKTDIIKKISGKSAVLTVPFSAALSLAIVLLNLNPVVKKPLLIDSLFADSVSVSVVNEQEITQDFYLKSPFSKITVFSESDGKYPDIRVLNEENKPIEIKKIRLLKAKSDGEAYYKKRESDMNKYIIYLKEYIPKKTERFKIILKNGSFYLNDTYGVKNFPGELSVKGKSENRNLVMKVS